MHEVEAASSESEKGTVKRPYKISSDRRYSRDLESLEVDDYYTYGSPALFQVKTVTWTVKNRHTSNRGKTTITYTVTIVSYACKKDGTNKFTWAGTLQTKTHSFTYKMYE
ncbi:MAG: hypothetical protein RLZZ283_701 [Candidatus Parcubacteria bacterium]|jgi:ABC-type molybdate transport system substrate-binding protein